MSSAPGEQPRASAAAAGRPTAPNPARARLEAVDMVRGVAIAVVIAFHSRNYSLVLPPQPGTVTSIAWAALTQLFLVPVPVFIILSGLVLGGRPRATESRRGFAADRLRRLLIPLAAWSLVAVLVSVTIQGLSRPSGTWDWVSTLLFGSRWYPLYFLVAALQLSLIVAVLPRARRSRDAAALGLIGLQLAAVGALQIVVHLRPDDLAPISAQSSYLALSWTGYFALGLLAAPRLARIRAASAAVRVATCAAAVASWAWIAEIARAGGALSYYQSPLHMVFTTAMALLGLWWLPALPAAVRRGLAALGVVSFGVYLAHGLVLPGIAWLAGPGRQLQPALGGHWLDWLGVSAATLAGALLAQRLLRATALGRLVLGEPARSRRTPAGPPRRPGAEAIAATASGGDAYTAGAV